MPVISSTQIKKFQACPKQWAYRYLERLPEPQKAGAAVGELAHWLCESALTVEGNVPRPKPETWELAGKNDQQIHAIMTPFFGSKHMPPPGAVPEQKFTLTLPGTDIPFVGKIDWIFPIAHGPGGNPMKCVEVGDLKTCKSFHYMMNALLLSEDIAAKAYAVAMLGDPSWECLKLNWVYVKTTKDRSLGGYPEPRAVSVWLPRKRVEENRLDVYEAAAPLVEHYENPQKECAPNPGEACSAYGGCAFKERCPYFTSNSKGKGMKTADINAILDKHIATQGDAYVPNMAPPVVGLQKPDPLQDPEKVAKVTELYKRLEAVGAPPAEPPTQVEASRPIPPPIEALEKPPTRRRGRPKGSKNKPKSLPQQDHSLVECGPVEDKVLTVPEPVASHPVSPPELPHPVSPPELPLTTPQELPQPAPHPVSPQELPQPAPHPVSPQELPQPAPVRRTLYVNCAPARHQAPFVYETEAYKRAAAAASEIAGCDWRLAEYGKGPNILATVFMRFTDTLPHSIRIDRTAESNALKSSLVAWADEIVENAG